MARSTGRQAGGARSRVGTAPALPVSCAQPPCACQALHNYAADAGRGSDTFSASDTWRAALLGTVAAGALFFGYGRSARAACAGPSPTLTCTGIIAGNAAPGVVNGGINVPAGYTTLNVNSITADITPNSGDDGIYVYTNSDITINSNTGPFSIIATGAGADGIYARSKRCLTLRV